MSAQTNPIDVLAVMGRAAESAQRIVEASKGDMRAVIYQDDLFKARAAIDELIEADKEYDAAKYAHACIAHESYEMEAWYDHDERLRAASQRFLLAGERRRAALANVSGGAA